MKLLHAALISAGLTVWAMPASAQQQRANAPAPQQQRMGAAADSWGGYLGASVGDTDFDTGFKFFLGQQFHPNLAWEAQFVHFGERENWRYSNSRDSAWSLGGSLVGLLPLNTDFSLFGKLGAHYVKTRVERPGYSASDSDIDIGVGIGGRYRINQQLSVRLEFEDIGDAGDMLSVGLQYRF